MGVTAASLAQDGPRESCSRTDSTARAKTVHRHVRDVLTMNNWAHNPQKALADCGAASLCLHHGRLLSALVSSMARRLLATTSRIRNEEKKETKKIARGIFRSLAPLLGTAGSLSDCGIKPTIAELNFSRR